MTDEDLSPTESALRLADSYSTLVTVLALAGVGGVAYAAWSGMIPTPTLPPWLAQISRYAAVGAVPGLILSYLVVRYFDSPQGLELNVLHPIEADMQHLRIGREKFEEMEVRDILGNEVGKDELHEITLNGRPGYEVIDYDREENVAVANWMGGATPKELRSYKKMVVYVQKKLSREADKSIELQANQQPIARDVARRVANHLIRVHEKATVPGDDALIRDAIDEVMQDYGMDDPLEGDVELGGDVNMDNPVDEHADTLTNTTPSNDD